MQDRGQSASVSPIRPTTRHEQRTGAPCPKIQPLKKARTCGKQRNERERDMKIVPSLSTHMQLALAGFPHVANSSRNDWRPCDETMDRPERGPENRPEDKTARGAGAGGDGHCRDRICDSGHDPGHDIGRGAGGQPIRPPGAQGRRRISGTCHQRPGHGGRDRVLSAGRRLARDLPRRRPGGNAGRMGLARHRQGHRSRIAESQ